MRISSEKPTEDLFDARPGGVAEGSAPLADRMRSQTLHDFVGQEHLLGKEKVLRNTIEMGHIYSMIFWGPPGTGKTTLAGIVARASGCHFIGFSAVFSGVKEIREVVEEARGRRKYHDQRTVLFVDEIHRFNKAQQDAFLPHVEKGTVILIGATTENPSFEVIPPLLSRVKVFVLKPLEKEDILHILRQALSNRERGLAELNVDAPDEILDSIAVFANGDARVGLNTLELAVGLTPPDRESRRSLTPKILKEVLGKKSLIYDKDGESITISYLPSTRASEEETQTRRFTGWDACWKQGKIRYILFGEWCALPRKTWEMPTLKRFKPRLPPPRLSVLSVRPRDIWHWLRPLSIWPLPRRVMRFTWPIEK